MTRGRRSDRAAPSSCSFALAAAVALCTVHDHAAAQLQISGHVEATALSDDEGRRLNTNFRGDSPFNDIRARLFAQRWLTDRAGVFVELLYDNRSGPRLNGAYLVLNEIAGRPWLNVRAGLAPSLIGSFGLRSTYFNANPLIGVPLVWQHRTTLDGSGLMTPADLLRRRATNVIGLPMLYDACWNLQWELLGTAGIWEYSVGVTGGAVSNPNNALAEDGMQALARLGVEPLPGLRLGVSGAYGAYLGGDSFDPLITGTSYPGEPDDYPQRLVGIDAEYAMGKLHLWSEAYTSSWEAPLVPERLRATAGYIEARYDVLPAWFAAVRTGAMLFSDIADPGGGSTGWDDDILRIESSLTYRWAREIHVRAGWQHAHFLTGGDDPVDMLALQLRAVF